MAKRVEAKKGRAKAAIGNVHAKKGEVEAAIGADVSDASFIEPDENQKRHFTIAQNPSGTFSGAYEDFGNEAGSKNCFLVTCFDQNVPHGSSIEKDKNPSAPILPLGCLHSAHEPDLVMIVRTIMQAHGMFVAAVGAEADADNFLSLLTADLQELAPNGLALGKPNSRRIGLVRGRCVPHGRAAAFVTSQPDIVALMRIVCKAFGKLDPWDPAFGGKPCTSFDAVLMSDPEHCEGIPSHVDASEIEPGRRKMQCGSSNSEGLEQKRRATRHAFILTK